MNINNEPTIEPRTITGIFTKYIAKTLPLAFDESMSYYECLCALLKYINDTVVPDINNVNDGLSELQTFYTQLQEFVNHYFDNLDVQEEIDNKLDEMAQDGSLTNLIENYVDPIINLQNQRIDNISLAVDNMNTKVDAATSGSPLAASSTSEMTDETRIYVNTTDGYWYYYNGTAWVQGGVYQATEDSDTVSQLADTIDNTILTYHGNNFIDENTWETGQLQSDGSILTGGNYDNYRTTDFIPVGNNTEFKSYSYSLTDPTTKVNNARRWILFDASKNVIADSFVSETTKNSTINVENASYFKYCYSPSSCHTMLVQGNGQMFYEPYTLHYVSTTEIIDDNKYKTISEFKEGIVSKNIDHNKNLHNPSTDETDKYLDSYNIITLSNYNTTDYIPVYANRNVVVSPYCRAYTLYDELKRPYYNYGTSATTPITITPRENGYVRVSYASSLSNLQIEYDEQTSYVNPEFIEKFEENVHLSDTMIDDIQNVLTSNVLSNKKLVTCGDSFTAYTNAQFDSGIYEGLDKVWPYLIGLRNNMTVVNMAISGSTMAINNYSENNFANNMYTQIPSDADYIIIKYGINDQHGSTPIGTIDSTDDTTFYGAWNKVMSYIIANHPIAKIGLIVTNGLTLNTSYPNNNRYANAIIEIAQKYGVPYLNEWNDPNVPLLLRTGRDDVLESIRDIRTETFRVDASNLHENYICHEYESTFIEDFLRRL